MVQYCSTEPSPRARMSVTPCCFRRETEEAAVMAPARFGSRRWGAEEARTLSARSC
jgi:hypothetical protein